MSYWSWQPYLNPSRARSVAVKGDEIRDTKTLNFSRNFVSLQVLVDVSRFSPCVINLSRNKSICGGLKNVVAKSRARVYFEQQIFGLIARFSRNKFARTLANQPMRALDFFNPNKSFCCGSS